MNKNMLLVSAALLAMTSSTAAQFPSAYTLLDRIEDDWVNRNPVPTRPMVALPNGTLWSVHPYQNKIVPITNFAAPGPSPAPAVGTAVFTLPGPVAIASYQDGSNTRLLVVCQHANAVAVHDASTGNMLGAIHVEAQPGDVLVDEENHAFVSCPGADVVVEIDLTDSAFPRVATYSIPARQPTFLTLYEDEVLVAPRISGNGSLVDRKPKTENSAESLAIDEHAGPMGIRDTLLPDVADVGLPDEDLFWLDRTTQTAEAIARSTGTILLANALQPRASTEDPFVLWQLNLEANNKNPDLQSEHSIRGEVVFNRLTKITLPAPGVVPSPLLQEDEHEILQLNDIEPGSTETVEFPADRDHVIGTPYSLAFTSTYEDGRCYVAGLLTDNVIAFDLNGERVSGEEFELAAGTMPRQVLVSSNDAALAVWGHGENTGDATEFLGDCRVIVYQLSSPSTPAILSLGRDPTPHEIRKGRKLFFDASHSQENDSSCASCHDEGKTDMLAWNLSNIETFEEGNADDDGFDNKGPMITQTLVGINTAVPFHWRGEQMGGEADGQSRPLLDFNAAFGDLLGDPANPPGLDEAVGDEFDQFSAFVLSLTEDANQYENLNRILDDTIYPPNEEGDPVTTALARAGQAAFDAVGCISCHTLPKGTSNEVVNNSFSGEQLARRLWLKNAPFQGLQFKGTQTRTVVEFNGDHNGGHLEEHDDQFYPIVGSGLGHAGVVEHLLSFVLTMVPEVDNEDDDDLTREALVSYLHQFDTGTAPAAHQFLYVDTGDVENGQWVQSALDQLNYLKAQAEARNCDIVVIGRAVDGTPTALQGAVRGWALRRSSLGESALNTMKFKNEFAPLVSAQSTDYFKSRADATGAWFAFIGVPLGTARKFAIDFDGDELSTGLEPAGGLFDTDTDGDGYWDGLEYNGSGNANNSAVHPTDSTAPAFVTTPTGLQWHTQKVGRLTFETSELSRARLELTASGYPDVVVEELTPKMTHNLVVNSMLAGVTYDADLFVEDLMPTPNAHSTVEFQVTTDALNDIERNVNSFVVENLELDTPSYVGGDWEFSATGDIVIRHENPAATASVDDVYVIARVLIRSPGAGLSVGKPAVNADFVQPGSPRTAFDNPLVVPFRIERLDSNGDPLFDAEEYTAISPPFVVDLTSSTGHFNIQFTLDGARIDSDDVITVSIETALPWLRNENHDMVSGSEVPILSGNGVNDRFEAEDGVDENVPGNWSFSDTLPENRRKEVTVP